MPAYKLYYFPARGGAEMIRFVFAQAGVEYEDVRVPWGEEWDKLKPNTPWGVMPFIEMDGTTRIGGSHVILRFLGEKFGLAGSNDVENAQIAAAVDAILDVAKEVSKILFEKDEERKAAGKKELEETKLPGKLQFFENLIAKSTATEGWLFNKLTYADFAFVTMISARGGMVTKAGFGASVDKFPKIRAHQQAVESLPNIKQWIEKRPESEY